MLNWAVLRPLTPHENPTGYKVRWWERERRRVPSLCFPKEKRELSQLLTPPESWALLAAVGAQIPVLELVTTKQPP